MSHTHSFSENGRNKVFLPNIARYLTFFPSTVEIITKLNFYSESINISSYISKKNRDPLDLTWYEKNLKYARSF